MSGAHALGRALGVSASTGPGGEMPRTPSHHRPGRRRPDASSGRAVRPGLTHRVRTTGLPERRSTTPREAGRVRPARAGRSSERRERDRPPPTSLAGLEITRKNHRPGRALIGDRLGATRGSLPRAAGPRPQVQITAGSGDRWIGRRCRGMRAVRLLSSARTGCYPGTGCRES